MRSFCQLYFQFAILLIHLYNISFAAPISLQNTNIFPPTHQSCVSGNACTYQFHSKLTIVCKSYNSVINHITVWKCQPQNNLMYSLLFRIHHARVNCKINEDCRLEYYLDFSPFTIFLCGLITTVFIGLLLALAMYVAVIKLASGFHTHTNTNNIYKKQIEMESDYGTFGRFIKMPNNVSFSCTSLQDLDIEPPEDVSDSVSVQSIDLKDTDKNKLDAELLQSQIYLG